MSILSTYTGYDGFKLIDDATGAEVENVMWVDDEHLEYAVISQPPRFSGIEIATDIVKVTRVSVNYAAREIHVNEPQPVVLTVTLGKCAQEQGACEECCDEGACRRCNLCLRFKAPFGEVSLP